MSDEKKLRFFGDGEAFGDGGAWIYLGSTPEQVAEAVRAWAGQVSEGSESCIIKPVMMTDAEVDDLPEM